MSQRKVIQSSVDKVQVDLNNIDILLEVGEGKSSSIIYDDAFQINVEENVLKVSNREENGVTVISNGMSDYHVRDDSDIEIIGYSNGKVEDDDRKTIFEKGNVLSVNKKILNKKNQIKFIISKNSQYDFSIVTKKGNVFSNQVCFNNLEVTTQTGDIKLIDVNSVKSYIETDTGDVTVTVLDTLKNYRSILKTISGNIQQEVIETNQNVVKEKQRLLDISSKYGTINVTYQGKQK